MEYKKEAQQLTDKKTGKGIYPIVRASDLKNDDGTPYVLPAKLEPSGTDTSTNILGFTSDKGIYIATDNGHWYYWNGSSYKDGGAYQGQYVNILSTGLQYASIDYMRTTFITEQEVSPSEKDFNQYFNNDFISIKTAENVSGLTYRIFHKVCNSQTYIFYIMSLKDGVFMLTVDNQVVDNVVFKLSFHPYSAPYDIGLDMTSIDNMQSITTETEVFPTNIPQSFADITEIVINTTDDRAFRYFVKVTGDGYGYALFMMPQKNGNYVLRFQENRAYFMFLPYSPNADELTPTLEWIGGSMIYITGHGATMANGKYSYTNYFEVKGYKFITFTIPTAPESVQNAGLAFYDISKKFISGVTHLGNQASSSYTTITIEVPKNAIYARTDFRTAELSNFSLRLVQKMPYTDKNLITSTDERSGKVPTYNEIIAKYDALLGEHTDIIVADDDTGGTSASIPYKYRVTKKELGKDGSNQYSIYEYTFSPTDYSWTVYFHFVMHGYEEQTTLAMYQLLEHIVNYDDICKKSPILSYIRKHVRIYIIPVQNPYGLTNRKYTGIDGINVSRNFPYYWSEYPATNTEWDKKGTKPFSSTEAQMLLKGYLEHASEIDFDIDYHTGDGWTNFPMFYYDNTDDFVKPALLEAGNYMISKGFSNNPIMQETGRALNIFWVNRCLGIPSATIEVGPDYFSTTRNSSEQLAPLMRSYTCYWTSLFNQDKYKHRLQSPSLYRTTSSEYNNMPFHFFKTTYILTDQNNKKMQGDFDYETGWLEDTGVSGCLDTGLEFDTLNDLRALTTRTEVSPTVTNLSQYDNAMFISVKTKDNPSNPSNRIFTKTANTNTNDVNYYSYVLHVSDGTVFFYIDSSREDIFTMQFVPNQSS